MKSKLSWVYSAFWGLIILASFISFSSNPPDGRTGASGDGFCTDCHTPGNPNGYDGTISIQNFPASITAGQTYSLTAVVDNPNGLASRAGFQAVVLDSGDLNAGDLTAPGNPTTTTTGGREYVDHNPAINFPASNQVTWNFDWTAPNGPNGENITLYAAGNIASGSSGNSDDFIVSTSVSGTLVAAPAALTVSIISTLDVTCNGDSTGQAIAEAMGGTPPYNYFWPDGLTGATVTTLPAGSFTVTVTDSGTETATATGTIFEPEVLVPSIVAQTNIDCNIGFGSALLTATGGTPGYFYLWPSGNTNSQEINLIAGVHTATVTDGEGCMETIDVIITEDIDTPTADAGPDQILNCLNPTVELNGSASSSGANISYLWSTMDGNILSSNTAVVIVVNQPGTYLLTVSDNSNGCFTQSTVQVLETPNTNIALVGTDPGCFNDSTGAINMAILAGEAPFVFDWSVNELDSIQNPTGLAAGTYSVTVTDSIGCMDMATTTLVDPIDIELIANFINPTCPAYCNGSIELIINGGVAPFSTLWSNGADTVFIENLCADEYTAYVTDANGCQDSLTISLFNPQIVQVSAALVDETCANNCDGSITITANGGTLPHTFAWEHDSNNTTNIATGCVGAYTVTVTDAIGCFTVYTDFISGPDSLNIAFSTSDPLCFDDCSGSIDLTVTGGVGMYSYDWSDPSIGNIPNPTMLCPGTYTVVVSDENLCEETATIILNNPLAIITTSSITPPSCNGNCDGSIEVTSTGGTGTLTYEWSTGFVGNPVTGICAGQYSVTITDANGCFAEETYSVTEPDQLIVDLTTTDETVSGANDGTATAIPTGGTSAYSYLWSNADTSSNITGLAPGAYSVTITDMNGCTTDATGTVLAANCTLETTVTTTNETGAGTNDGTATAIPANGTAAYTYLWSNADTTQTITGLAPGTYTVTVTDMAGCIAVGSNTVDPFVCDLQATVTTTGETGVDANDGTAMAIPTGGTADYTYLWDNAATTQMISNLNPGNYVVTVTDMAGCTFVAEGVVEAHTCDLEATVTATDETATNANDGTATVTPTNGTADYTYLWNTGDTTQMISDLSPGLYIVTVTDMAGCIFIAEDIVDPFACDLQADITIVNESAPNANDGMATAVPILGSGMFSYEWNTIETTQTISNLTPGVYSVTITDDITGCTAEAFGEVLPAGVGCDIQLEFNVTGVSCHGDSTGTVMVIPSNGVDPYTYNWSSGGDSNPATDLPAGTVTVTVTDDNGCEKIESITITEPTELLATAIGYNDSCNGGCFGRIEVVATGGAGLYTYDPPVLSNLCPGNYTITVTDANGCTTQTSATVPEGADPIQVTVTTNPVSTVGGNDGSATAMPMGGGPGYTFIWSNNATTQTITNLTEGQYCVTVTDITTGCNASACGIVGEAGCLLSLTTDLVFVDCAGENTGAATAIPSGAVGPVTYMWSSSFNNTAMETGLSAGPYSVTATDSLGCMATSNFEILEFPALELNVVTTSETAADANDGTATANISGGPSPNYTYLWNTGAVTQTIAPLNPGQYCVTVTDENGCTIEGCNSVNPFGCDVAISLSQDGFTCANTCDGEITVNVTGGTGVYTYSWEGPTIIPDSNAVGLCPGAYSLTVTDSEGCTAEASTVINTYTEMEIVPDVTQSSCNGSCDGAIILFVSGDGPFTFDWEIDSLDGMDTVMNLCAAQYALTITDGNGCSSDVNFILVEDAGISIQTNVIAACFDECNGQLSFDLSGGTPPYNVASNLPSNLTQVCPDDYTLDITDANGCALSTVITVPENPEIIITIDEVGDAEQGLNNGFVNTTVSGGSPSYSYEWILNNEVVSTDEDPQGLAAGQYDFVVTDELGCVASDTVTINQTVGTIGIFTANSISLFPNPASTAVYLNFDVKESMEVNIAMYDLLGKKVLTDNRLIGQSQTEQINTSQLMTGMYTLVIYSGESMWSEKVIIQQR